MKTFLLNLPIKSGIYQILNLTNNKCYVGSSKDILKRHKQHTQALRRNKHINKKLQNAYNKHTELHFTFNVLEVCNVDQLIQREQHHIDSTKSDYNIRKIAQSNQGLKQTAAAKAKLSALYKGVAKPKRTSEHRLNLAASLKGKNKGVPKPTGFKQHLSTIRTGNKNPSFGKPSKQAKKINQIAITSGTILATFNSATEAIAKLNAPGIRNCLAGRTQTAAGFRWQYSK